MKRKKKAEEGWTVADAKARLSEILRLANDQPQYIGTNKSHIIVSTEVWKSLNSRPAMGSWLIDSLKGSGELVLPDRGEPDRNTQDE